MSILWATGDRTARAGSDYVPSIAVTTIGTTQQLGLGRVTIVDDVVHESSETMSLRVLAASNAQPVRATATGTIVDND